MSRTTYEVQPPTADTYSMTTKNRKHTTAAQARTNYKWRVAARRHNSSNWQNNRSMLPAGYLFRSWTS